MTPAPDTPRPVCPQCKRPFSPGRENCMWCGAALDEVEVPLQEYDCPVCEGKLRPQEGEGWSVHICDQCTGIWMVDAMMRKLEAAYEEVQPENTGRRGFDQGAPSAKEVVEGEADFDFRYRRCPECRGIMTRRRYKISTVVLDECMGHGTWFDAHEFEKVLGYLKAGGLAQAEEAEKRRRAGEQKPRYLKGSDWNHHHFGGIGYFGSFYSF